MSNARTFISNPSGSGAFTFATLPAVAKMVGEIPGVQAYTSDQGICTWNGSAWVASTVPIDNRKLTNFFSGGVSGKKIGWVGDSTTQVMANMSGIGILFSALQTNVNAGAPNPTTLAPGLAGTLHVNRGKNGASLAVFVTSTALNSLVTAASEVTVAADLTNNNGTGVNSTYDVSLARIIQENYDLVVLCYGINDVRGALSWSGSFPDFRGVGYGVGNSKTAALYMVTQYLSVINALTASNPNICIILRLVNPGVTGGSGWIVPPGGGAAVTPTDGLNVLAYAHRNIASLNLPNVLVWDSMASLYPQGAVANATSNALVGNDSGVGLHPTNPSGYLAVIQAVSQIMSPLVTASSLLSSQQVTANHSEKTLGLLWTAPTLDSTFYLDPNEWYPAYQVICPTAGSNFFRVQSNESDITANNAGLQMAGVTTFGHSPANDAPFGKCVGDVILWPGIPYITRIVNVEALTGNPFMQWNPSASGTNICGIDDGATSGAGGFLSNNPATFSGQTGVIYRHRYAFSPAAKSLLLNQSVSQYQKNLFPNAYRFQVCFFFGAFVSGTAYLVIQPIPGELAANGKNLSAHTITTSDLMTLAGADGANFASGSSGVNALGLVLTSATITNASANQVSTACTATNATPCVFTATAHGYSNGQCVYLGGTAVPGGFIAGLPYFVVVAAANTFELASTPAGAAKASSSTGTSVTVQAVPQASTIQIADVANHDFTQFVSPQGFVFSAT